MPTSRRAFPRGPRRGLVKFNLVQLGDFAHDRLATVDDYAYGGGAGDGAQARAVLRSGGSLAAAPEETGPAHSAR